MAFLAVVRAPALRDGGSRNALPVGAAISVDPTDADVARAARARPPTPEERLRLAVFIAALNELQRYPRATDEGRAVRAWFADDDLTWPYSFVPLCEGIGLDPGAVRRRLLHGSRTLLAATGAMWGPSVRRAAAR